jgi:xylitol oxidase
MADTLRNWAGNIDYSTAAIHTPRSVGELQDLVRRLQRVRALGSRHSFNRIADTGGDLISLAQLKRVIGIDQAARTVTVEGGITYGELSPILHQAGFGLHNLASLPHISVVGASTTATHGSGVGNRNLATAVRSLTFITASGDAVTLSRGDADFEGAVVGLGALGVVSQVTLDLQPTFDVSQTLYMDLPVDALTANFEALASSAYSVSFFTLWEDDTVQQVWLKSLASEPARSGDLFGAKPATRPWHPIAAIDPAPCTEQMGVPGPWHLRLPHFRMEFTPSAGAELQSEYFVARKDAVAAFAALRKIQHVIAPQLLVSEIRTIAADDLWLSMNYKQDCVAFHFTFKPDWPSVEKVLPSIEAALAPFNPRPHWGKLFTMPARDVQARYTKLGDFRALALKHDPSGKFRNAFVDEFVFGA